MSHREEDRWNKRRPPSQGSHTNGDRRSIKFVGRQLKGKWETPEIAPSHRKELERVCKQNARTNKWEGETRKIENIPRKSNSREKREKKAGQGEKWKAKQIRPFLGDQARERKRAYSRETGKDCKAFCAEKRLRPKDGTVLKGEHW